MKYPLVCVMLTAAAGLAVVGCDKKAEVPAKPTSVPMVAESARSKAFEATVAHLDVGGPVFMFAETEGDPKRVADALLKFYAVGAAMDPNAPKAPATLDPFLTDLGVANIHATGFSSRREGAAYVNRSFLYTPGGPSGMTTLFGSKNSPFAAPTLAPADTLVAGEGELDTEKLVAVARGVVSHVGDGKAASAALEKLLKQPIPNSPYTTEKMLAHLNGRVFFGLQASGRLKTPTGDEIPAFDAVVALEGRESLYREISALIGMAGEQAPLVASEDATFLFLEMKEKVPAPFDRYSPVLALEKATKRLWVATNRATLAAWTGKTGAKLSGSTEYKRLSSGLASSGTGWFYIAPEADKPVRQVLDNASKQMQKLPQAKAMVPALSLYQDGLDALFPKDGAGVYSVSFVTADGLASESRCPISHKPGAYLWLSNSGANPVVVGGLGAALAIPAFKKVRNNAIEKTLMNDARQVSSAANQVWAENGTTTCRVADIRQFIPGLSSANRIGVAPDSGKLWYSNLQEYLSPAGGVLELKQGGKIVLGNPNYDRTLSNNPLILSGAASGDNTITFDLDTGMVSQ